MSSRVIRLGQPRLPAEGSRLGTVRRPPRGVKKSDFGRDANFSVGCYCEDETRCHRSILRELLEDAGAAIESPSGE
ncbi:MAG: hypothetical protein ABI681_13595 [Gemmatimonadales bacterium]